GKEIAITMKRWLVFLCLIVVTCWRPVLAQLTIDQQGKRLLAGRHLERYIGVENSSFSAILASSAFVPLDADVPNLGTSTSAVWLRFPIKNSSERDLDV